MFQKIFVVCPRLFEMLNVAVDHIPVRAIESPCVRKIFFNFHQGAMVKPGLFQTEGLATCAGADFDGCERGRSGHFGL